MKFTILFALSLLFLSVKGQNSPVQKVVFSYATGGNPFGQPGVYDKEEYIEMELNGNLYKVTQVYNVVESVTQNNNNITWHSDTVRFQSSNYHNISKHFVDSLLKQLTITKNNFTSAFILPRLTKPPRDLVIHLADESHNRYLLEDYNDKLDKYEVDKYRNFDKLPEFIHKIKPNINVHKRVSDAWDMLKITFYYSTGIREFHCDFMQPLGQPVYEYIEGKNLPPQFINLEINTYIESILPKSSMIVKRVSIDRFREDYIKWLLNPKAIDYQ